MTFKHVLCVGTAVATLAAGSANAAVINLVDLGGVIGSPAEQGFKVAASYWQSMLTNSATINLGVRFAPLAPGVIGSTRSSQQNFSVADWEAQVNATKSSSAIDTAIVLPTLSAGGITGALTVGVNGTGNNDTAVTAMLDPAQVAAQVLFSNTALVKAVGGAVDPGALAPLGGLDGRVTFSSTFAFDFDPRGGITAGTFDFIGVAIHEIGHALGFVSGVDFFDYFGFPSGPGRGALGYDLNDTSIFSALDMFRYSAPGTLDFRTGGTKYFSIDGGATALLGGRFSTGQFNGDGRQASHWKDTPACATGFGVMDPTFCFGQMGVVTALDIAGFDAMGWNTQIDALANRGNYRVTTGTILRNYLGTPGVPEPSTWALLVGGFGLAGAALRRRRALPATA